MKRLTKVFAVMLGIALVSGIAWAHEPHAAGPSSQGQQVTGPAAQGQMTNPPADSQRFNTMQSPYARRQNDLGYSSAHENYDCQHWWGRFAPGHMTRCYNNWSQTGHHNARHMGHRGGCWNSCW